MKNSDNKMNQLNPNNDAYWQLKGHGSRPQNWKQLLTDYVYTPCKLGPDDGGIDWPLSKDDY